MSDKKLDVDALVVEPTDDSQYAPTETHALTPEEAARKVLDTPASAAKEAPKANPMADTLPPGVTSREFGADSVTEYVDQSADLPVAVNAEADYEARVKDTSVDYEQMHESDEGETVEK